eukprot:scaffold41224_cov55-Cyclotella_meneghiniana.AAC.1
MREVEGLLEGQPVGDLVGSLEGGNVDRNGVIEEFGLGKGLMGDGKLGLTSELGGFIEGLVIGMVLCDTGVGINGEELETGKEELAVGVMEGVTVGDVLGDSVDKLFGKVLCGLVGNVNGGKVFGDSDGWT